MHFVSKLCILSFKKVIHQWHEEYSVLLFKYDFSQGGEEEEEEGEHFNGKAAARPAGEQEAAVDAPTEDLGERQQEEEEEEEREMKEVKTDEKSNLAGERQSGDGQVCNKKLNVL